MGEQFGRQPSVDAMKRSEVRRWCVPQLEQVHHRRLGQEWIPHWHAEWSIGAIVSGDCLCSINGHPVHGKSGDLVAIAPQTVHTGALLSQNTTEAVSVIMLYVSTEWFANARLLTPICSGFVHDPSIATRANQLRTGVEVEEWLYRAIKVLEYSLSSRPKDLDPSRTSRQLLLAFQEGILEGQSSVTELAHSCNVSRERLHRVIRRWTGMSPVHYIRAFRVNKAREMLLADESLATVAFTCGFSDQAHLTRSFRKSFGYTPGDLLAAISNQVK